MGFGVSLGFRVPGLEGKAEGVLPQLRPPDSPNRTSRDCWFWECYVGVSEH